MRRGRAPATTLKTLTTLTTRDQLRIYAMDGALLGLFMVSACLSVALVEHPGSPVRAAIASAFVRRALVGVAMGVTALVQELVRGTTLRQLIAQR